METSASTEGMKLKTLVKEKKELQKKNDQLESTLKKQDESSFQLLEEEKEQVT